MQAYFSLSQSRWEAYARSFSDTQKAQAYNKLLSHARISRRKKHNSLAFIRPLFRFSDPTLNKEKQQNWLRKMASCDFYRPDYDSEDTVLHTQFTGPKLGKGSIWKHHQLAQLGNSGKFWL
jgi:hypothetical protein